MNIKIYLLLLKITKSLIMEKMEIYKSLSVTPIEARKEIGAGRLKGMTDINPMWRIKKLTEAFGVCGFGWKYVVTNKRLENGCLGQISAFVDIDLFVKIGDTWSDAIPGTGGSSFVANEKNGLYQSDECFKMALTDAISVACKALGMSSDIYFSKDRTKYDNTVSEEIQTPTQAQPKPQLDTERLSTRLKACKTLDELQKTYLGFTAAEKISTEALKDELKTKLK